MLKQTHDLKTGLGRLARLADDLLNVPEGEFDLETWECGTAACAVGWACRMEWAQELGLQMTEERYPRYGLVSGIVAAKDFFEITVQEANQLFCPFLAYDIGRPLKDAKDQSRYMKEFLAKKGYYL